MLKHQEIIEKLTIEQKLRLLADIGSLAAANFDDLGFRSIARGSIEQVNDLTEGFRYPSFEAMANCWNLALVGSVSEALAVRAKKNGFTMVETPAANVKTTPYSQGLSEDPYMAGTLAGICASSGMRCGIKTVLTDPALKDSDVDYSDLQLDPDALNEYFKKSFGVALNYDVGAIKFSKHKLDGSYSEVNEEWQKSLAKKYPILHDCHSAHELLTLIREGKRYSTKGSYVALKEALLKYLSLQEAFELGGVSLNEIETECECGDAISPEMVDEAVDRIVHFALECQNMKVKGKPIVENEQLALAVAEESIVLLKNEDKLLPLKKGVRIGIVGDLASSNEVAGIAKYASQLTKSKRIACTGFARGYDVKVPRNDALVKEAVDLAQRSDVVVVVLGCNKDMAKKARQNRSAVLPANQIVLMEALAKTNAKLVAVVSSESYPDMKFDDCCTASLLAPLTGTKSAEALFRILLGLSSPSGKLACTCYNNTDEHYKMLRAYKDAKRNKVGTFYGYRHYDTAGYAVKYPFGHGLSYTEFKYSSIKVSAGNITFTVQNKGRKAASEVVQIYVGKKTGALIRPKKELKAFFKVFLKPGQSQRFTIRLSDLDLTVWNKNQGAFVCEQGIYRVYVGSSVRDIKSTKEFYYGNRRLEKTKERYSSYLQTYSNIHSGGYYLEEPVRTKKWTNKGGVGVAIWLVLTLCLDLIYAYFVYIRWAPNHWALYTAVGVLNAVPLLLTIILNAAYKGKIQKERDMTRKEKMKKREELKIEDLAEELPFEQLFEEEFAEPIVTKTQQEEKVEEKVSREESRVSQVPFDKEFPLTRVAKEFYTYAYERGVQISQSNICKLFAAFAASRLLIVKSSEWELFQKFLPILDEYLGSDSSVDSFAGVQTHEGSLLHRKDEFGNIVASDAANLIAGGQTGVNRLRLMYLLDVKVEGLKACLAPIIRYIDQPLRETKISIQLTGNGAIEQYTLSEDMWLVIMLADGESILDVPKYILDMASVVDLHLEMGMQPKTRLEVRKKAEASKEENLATVETEEENVSQEVETEEENVSQEVEAAEEIEIVQDSTEECVASVEETNVEEVPVEVEEVKLNTEAAPMEELAQAETAEDVVEATTETEETEVTTKEAEAVAAPAEGENTGDEEESIAAQKEADVEVVEVLLETEKTPVKQLIYSQFKKLAENASRDYQMDENLWKRIDKLENFVDECNEYRIENKQWQRMEKFASVYLAMGGEAEEALDCVIANHLIYGMLPCVINTKKPLEEKFTHTMENIFGEGNVPNAVKAIKETELDL